MPQLTDFQILQLAATLAAAKMPPQSTPEEQVAHFMDIARIIRSQTGYGLFGGDRQSR